MNSAAALQAERNQSIGAQAIGADVGRLGLVRFERLCGFATGGEGADPA